MRGSQRIGGEDESRGEERTEESYEGIGGKREEERRKGGEERGVDGREGG